MHGSRGPRPARRTNTASLSELKARLSGWLSKVRSGGVVIVTDRGKPIARITPASPQDDWDAHLRNLEAQGLVRRPTRSLSNEFFEQRLVKDPSGEVLKALLAERGEDRDDGRRRTMTRVKKKRVEMTFGSKDPQYLLGSFELSAKIDGWSEEQITSVVTEAKAGDFDHLVRTLMKYTVDPAKGDQEEHDR
jgi:prevent-host-death family protein